MNPLTRSYRWLADEPRHRTGVRMLQIAIGILLLFRVFTEGPFYSYLWGPHSLGASMSSGGSGVNWEDRLFSTNQNTVLILAAEGIAGLGLLFGKWTRLSNLLALVTFTLLNNRMSLLGDGGDNITQIVLVYMLFLIPAGVAQPRPKSLAVWLHNVAIVAITLQLIALYVTSGSAKMVGETWQHGTAMYYVTQVAWFTTPWAREIFKNPLFATLSTYVPMYYQILFPVAIVSRVKIPWLLLGIFFHIGTAVVMGLVTFATVMIGLELFLIDDSEWSAFFSWADSLKKTVTEIVRRPLLQPALSKGDSPVALRLFIDGYCPHCLAAGRAIRRLDRDGVIDVTSFRTDRSYRDYGLEEKDLLQRMHAVRPDSGDVWIGFAAVRVIVHVLPSLWALRPLLGLASLVGAGNIVYDALASRRRILPDARSCTDAGCVLQQSIQ